MKLLANKTTRGAILFTLLILIVYRLGSYIITPIINGQAILGADSAIGFENLFGLLGGGNIQFLTLFALGVSPYITASIVIQLLENDLVPSIAEWKHQGIDGQNKRYAWTKYLAVIFAFVQAFGITLSLYILKTSDIISPIPFTKGSEVGILEFLVIALYLTAGSTILMWLADRITEKGIGNGMSVIIMVGILARMPSELKSIGDSLWAAAFNEQKGIWDMDFMSNDLTWLLIAIIFIILVIFIVYYTLAYLLVDIYYVKNAKSTLSERSYIPIKLNPAGVIPVIFVAPLMQVPILLLKLPLFADNGIGKFETVFRAFFQVSGTYWYVAMVVYFVLILGFSIMYSYIQMNPQQMAENLEKQSAYIVGVRPGDDTENYLTKIITSTTVYGGIVLGILAILPIILQNFVSYATNSTFNLQLIGTGLIITINVLVQTYQAMENKTESKTYKKLF
ncbi:MAG: preprotein translocase subunit SecY [Mycoplasmatales bacterium]